MKLRYILFIIGIALIGIFVAREFASAQTLEEYYNTGDDDSFGAGQTVWDGQTLTTESAYTLEEVHIMVYKAGTPGTCTLGVRATTGGDPSGADLTSGSIDTTSITTNAAGEWITVDVTDYDLVTSTVYGLVLRCPSGDDSGNRLRWRGDSSSASYAFGSMKLSSDSGSSWTNYANNDFMFEMYSVDADPPATATTSATSTDAFIDYETRNVYYGFILFFISFFGLLFYFRKGVTS